MALALYLLVALYYLSATGLALLGLRLLRDLPAATPTTRRRVAAVIPIRDEATRVGTTMQRLIAQRAVDLQIVAVDDRSTDGTRAILAALQSTTPALQVIGVDAVPDGWTGKSHACHIGAAAARADWILFLDADCWLAPDVVGRAVQAAATAGAAHLTLFPVSQLTPLARPVFLQFAVPLLQQIGFVNRDAARAHVGLGAFNLVRADAYARIDGYRALRFEVVDDMKLAGLVRSAGYRSRVFFAGRDCVIDWLDTVPSFLRLLEKNQFAVLRYRLDRALVILLAGALLWGFAVAGPWSGGVAGIAAGAALASGAIPLALLARRLQWPLWTGVVAPLTVPLMLLVLLRSTVMTLARGGIRWRGTLYPLAALRARMVR